MRTSIKKTDNPRVWEWYVIDNCGDTVGHGYTKTKRAAESDASIWIADREAREARAAGRVVKGDAVKIKPEWQDPGDDQFNFTAVETQLKGMREIRIRATHKATGEPAIGTQSIMVDMLDR